MNRTAATLPQMGRVESGASTSSPGVPALDLSSPRVDGQATRGNCGGTAPLSTAAALSYPRRDQYHAPNHGPSYSGTDWCTPDNAYRLANRIKAYWAAKGKAVDVTVEPFAAPTSCAGSGWFSVRSNMVGGRPRAGHPMVRP